MIREKAPTILTAEGARRLTARIRESAFLTNDLLLQAYEGRVWEALEHESFDAWIEKALPDLAFVQLRAPERDARIEALLALDAPQRTMAKLTGASLGTVNGVVARLKGKAERSEMNTAPAVEYPTYWQVVHAIGKCGPAGGTTREVMKRLKWEQGPASAALSRAVKKGLLTATGERRHASGASIGHMVYVVAE